MKVFTSKQVFILVSAIIVGIAFMETSAPVWTFIFWRNFLRHIFAYSLIAAFIVVALGAVTSIFDDEDS